MTCKGKHLPLFGLKFETFIYEKKSSWGKLKVPLILYCVHIQLLILQYGFKTYSYI